MMQTGTISHAETQTARVAGFDRFAGGAAIVTGVLSLAYAVAFLILKINWLADLLLAIGGLLSTAVITAIYQRVRQTDAGFALWGVLLGFVAGMGTTIHGMYNLTNDITAPPASLHDLSAVPLAIDPRGLLAFGVAGLSVGIFAMLITRGGQLPKALGNLGYVLSVLLIALYLGTLLTNNDTHSLAVLIPGGLASLIVNPAWYIGVGFVLSKSPRAS
ncbi:MAG TPA: hypothetical protein VKB76_10345 [Ktedonobacterales bacterium]|nr:hypothetical protein [Ktedonobacterales bacterium]